MVQEINTVHSQMARRCGWKAKLNPQSRKRESCKAGNARMVFEDIWTYGKLGRQRRLEFWRQYSPHVYDNLRLHYPLEEITDLHPPAVIAVPDIDNLNDWSRINRSRGTTQTTLLDFFVRTNRPLWRTNRPLWKRGVLHKRS